MASKSGKKKTTTRKQTGQSSRKGSQQKRAYTAQENAIFHEVELIILFAVVVFLFLCNPGLELLGHLAVLVLVL